MIVAIWVILFCCQNDPTNVPPEPFECAHARSFSFDFSGRRLACVTQRNELLIWDGGVAAPTSIPLLKKQGNVASIAAPMGCVLDADGRNAVVVYFDGRAQVWSVETKSKVRDLPCDQVSLTNVRISPDGRLVAAISFGILQKGVIKQSRLHLWNTRDWSSAGVILSDSPAYDYCFSPNGRQIIACVGFSDRKAEGFTGIVAWDVETKMETGRIEYGSGRPGRIAISPDGKWIATGGGDAVPTSETSRSLSGHLRVFAWEEKKFAAELYTLPTDYVHSVQFSTDGRTLYSGSYSPPPKPGSYIAELKGHAVGDWALQWTTTLGTGNPHEVAVSPLGSTVLAADSDHLFVVDAKEGIVQGKKLKYKFYPEDQPKINVGGAKGAKK